MINEIKKSNKQHKTFMATIILVAAVLLAGNILVKNTSDIINVICIVIFPFLNVSGVVALVCFFIPVHSGISGIYILGYAVIIIILKERKLEIKTLIFFCMVALLEVFLCLFAPNFQLMKVIPYLCALFIFIYGINNKTSIDYKQCCYSYIFGTILLMSCVFITSSMTYGLEEIFSGYFRIGINDEILNSTTNIAFISDNPNALGCYSASSIVLTLFLFSNKGKYLKILFIVSLLVNIFVGALTISRTWLAVTALGIASYVLLGTKVKNRLLILIVIASVIAIAIYCLDTYTNIIKAFVARLDGVDLSDNDRTYINSMYINWMIERPFHFILGTGATFYQDVCNLGIALHSGPVHVFVAYGILGSIFFIVLLTTPIFGYFANRPFKIAKILPLLVAITFTLTGHFLNPYYLMFPYMVAIFYMRIDENTGAQ